MQRDASGSAGYTTLPIWPPAAVISNLRAMPDSDLERLREALEAELLARKIGRR